jgi:hypothetical protein
MVKWINETEVADSVVLKDKTTGISYIAHPPAGAEFERGNSILWPKSSGVYRVVITNWLGDRKFEVVFPDGWEA